jgi:hypothetical protein
VEAVNSCTRTLIFDPSFIAFLCYFSFFLFIIFAFFVFQFFYCPFPFFPFFFTFVFVSVFRLLWVSSLAYSNLLRSKRFGCCLIPTANIDFIGSQHMQHACRVLLYYQNINDAWSIECFGKTDPNSLIKIISIILDQKTYRSAIDYKKQNETVFS